MPTTPLFTNMLYLHHSLVLSTREWSKYKLYFNGNAYVPKSPTKCPIERKILTSPKNDASTSMSVCKGLVGLLELFCIS